MYNFPVGHEGNREGLGSFHFKIWVTGSVGKHQGSKVGYSRSESGI